MLQNLFKSFKKKPQKEYLLALDIGTEFVKALIFNIENKESHVIGIGVQKQKLGDMHGGAITDIQGVVWNCKQAIQEAEHMAGQKAKKVVLGIAGELVKGSTTRIHYERNTPKDQITLAELKNIVHKVQWKAFDQVRSQLAWETGYPEIDVKLVNAAVVDVMIDGYKITNPIGFQGKDIHISIFNAFAPLVHLGALQTVADELDLEVIALSAEPYAVAKSCKQDQEHLSAVFIDIGGGTTDIAVVRDGGVEGTKMFGFGGRSFTKRLSQVLNVSFQEAENVKHAYSHDRLDRLSRTKVEKSLQSDVDVWVSGVEVTLSDFYNIDLMPSQIYLCGGGAHLPEMKAVLEKHVWSDSIAFAKSPQVSLLEPVDVTRVVDKTSIIKNTDFITSLSLSSLLIDIEEENDIIVSKILDRVVKMIHT